MCVPECRYGHLVHAGACRGQKRASGSLEMELQAVVIRVLGETSISGRAASALSFQACSPALPTIVFCYSTSVRIDSLPMLRTGNVAP